MMMDTVTVPNPGISTSHGSPSVITMSSEGQNLDDDFVLNWMETHAGRSPNSNPTLLEPILAMVTQSLAAISSLWGAKVWRGTDLHGFGDPAGLQVAGLADLAADLPAAVQVRHPPGHLSHGSKEGTLTCKRLFR